MGGAVLASLVHTDVWSQVQRQFHAWFPLYQETLVLAPEDLPEKPLPEVARTSLALLQEREQAPEMVPEMAPEMAPEMVPEPVPEMAKPHVTTAGEQLILTIPISGSLKEAEHYPLSQPDGVVVNLPHGQASAPRGNYSVKQGKFRLVWIRKRAAGVHIRVFFKGQQVPFTLELLPHSILVKIKA